MTRFFKFFLFSILFCTVGAYADGKCDLIGDNGGLKPSVEINSSNPITYSCSQYSFPFPLKPPQISPALIGIQPGDTTTFTGSCITNGIPRTGSCNLTVNFTPQLAGTRSNLQLNIVLVGGGTIIAPSVSTTVQSAPPVLTWPNPNFNPSDITTTTAKLSWNPATGPAGTITYKIKLDDGSSFETTDTYYSLENLKPGTTYNPSITATEGDQSVGPVTTTFETNPTPKKAQLQFVNASIINPTVAIKKTATFTATFKNAGSEKTGRLTLTPSSPSAGTLSVSGCSTPLDPDGICQAIATYTAPDTVPTHPTVSLQLTLSETDTPDDKAVTPPESTTITDTPSINLVNPTYDTGISDTIYEGSNFNYKPTFVFVNAKDDTINNLTASITSQNLTGVSIKCNGTSIGANDKCNLLANGIYEITGTMPNPVKHGDNSIAITFSDGTATQVYTKNIYAIPYIADHVAIRFIKQPTDIAPIWVASRVNQNSIDFNNNGDGEGKIITDKPYNWYTYDYNVIANKDNQYIIYYPITNAGAVMAVSRSQFPSSLPDKTDPSVTGDPSPPPYAWIEPGYYQETHGEDPHTIINERFVVDLSYVNFVALPIKMNLMGQSSLGIPQQDVDFGETATATTRENDFSAISAKLSSTPWSDLVKYENGSTGPIKWILAPIQEDTNFSNDYFAQYTDALWTYLKNNPTKIKIPVSELVDPDKKKDYSECVLEGTISGDSISFNVASGLNPATGRAYSCPPEGSLFNPVVWDTNRTDCAPGEGGDPKKTGKDWPCFDKTKNEGLPVVIQKFQSCDYIDAAGSTQCQNSGLSKNPNIDINKLNGLWGPNLSYRAIIGKAIASYQATGLLPSKDLMNPVTGDNGVLSSEKVRTHMNDYYQDNYSTLLCGSPGCITNAAYNVYAGALATFYDVYAYSYGDFLGMDKTVTFYNGDDVTDYPYALPITITLEN